MNYANGNILLASGAILTLARLTEGTEAEALLDTALDWVEAEWPETCESIWFCRLGDSLTQLYGSLQELEEYPTSFPTDLLVQRNPGFQTLLRKIEDDGRFSLEIRSISLAGFNGIWLLLTKA